MSTQDGLFGIWSSLSTPAAGEWRALRVGLGDVRVARSSANSAALIAPVVDGECVGDKYGLRTSHVEYFPARDLVVSDGTMIRRGQYAVLECSAADEELVRYFLRLCQAILLDVAGQVVDIDAAVRGVFELFRSMSSAGRRSLQGLWAELLIVVHSRDPTYLVRAWHSDPSDLHDFVGELWRLEVKSTTRGLREHEFALDQLVHDAPHTAVASVLLTPDDGGPSVFDLLNAGRERLNDDGARRRLETIVAESLGSAWRDADDVRFDQLSALASLHFYAAPAIPRVAAPLPSEVRDVHFRADLTTLSPPFEPAPEHALVHAIRIGQPSPRSPFLAATSRGR